MKQVIKASYFIRMLFFIFQFYFVFMMLENILDTKYLGPFFIILYLTYILYILLQLLSKKKEYKKDLIYNIMQIGLFLYLIVLSLKICILKIYVSVNTDSYFYTNYGILSLLIIFILAYSFLEFKKDKYKK